jgi:hypothetical protein
MLATYKVILSLFPTRYRAAFAEEMANVFEKSAGDVRKRGRLPAIWFFTYECAGLMKGLMRERLTRWMKRESYMSAALLPADGILLPEPVAKARDHWKETISLMEVAIAQHDFPAARRYSRREELARRALVDQIQAHGVDASVVFGPRDSALTDSAQIA